MKRQGRISRSPSVHADDEFELYDNLDESKRLKFQLEGITTGTTRTLDVPDADGEIALIGQHHISLLTISEALTY